MAREPQTSRVAAGQESGAEDVVGTVSLKKRQN